jgi:hypothetical protein
MVNRKALSEQLREYVADLQSELEQVRRDAEALAQREDDVRARLEAANEILQRERSVPEDVSLQRALIETEVETTHSPRALRGRTIADAAALVLADRSAPMKVREIADELKDGGLLGGSRDPWRTLNSTLIRNPSRFLKVGPGKYALRPHGGANARSERKGLRRKRRGLVRWAYDVLQGRRKPLHVRDILDQMTAEGFTYATQRPTAMLSGSLKKSPRFRLCGGDVWALAEWPEEACKNKAEA